MTAVRVTTMRMVGVVCDMPARLEQHLIASTVAHYHQHCDVHARLCTWGEAGTVGAADKVSMYIRHVYVYIIVHSVSALLQAPTKASPVGKAGQSPGLHACAAQWYVASMAHKLLWLTHPTAVAALVGRLVPLLVGTHRHVHCLPVGEHHACGTRARPDQTRAPNTHTHTHAHARTRTHMHMHARTQTDTRARVNARSTFQCAGSGNVDCACVAARTPHS